MQQVFHDSHPCILVTGGAGYIGSHFVNRYLSRKPDQRVIILDDLSEGNPEALAALSNRFPERVSSYQTKMSEASVREIFSRHAIRAVVHFAASALVARSQQYPLSYLRNNVGETLALLEHMAAAGVDKMVFSSTAAVYGTPDKALIDEDERKAPVNVYGRTKLMVEEMLALLHEREKLSYMALRYFNAAGADESGLIGEGHHEETHLIPIILQVANGKREHIQIYGNDYATPDGTCIRDYIHVNDLADAHIAALDYLETQPRVGMACNLGTGQGNSVQEIIDRCLAITGRDIPTRTAPRREGDPPVLVANPELARRVLNWQSRYNLDDIIQTAWHWEQNRQFCR